MENIKKVLVIGLLFLLLGAGVTLGVSAAQDSKLIPTGRAAWSDNFDSYETGSALHGQGGWWAWDNLSENTGYVSDTQALSAPNSLEVKWTTTTVWVDMVHQYFDVNSGNWTYQAWLYVPSEMTGNSYFILMNTYTPGGTHNNQDWSLQLEFSASGGTIFDFNDATKTLPLIKDAWTQIRVQIDFEADVQTVYYGDQFLLSKSWKNGVAQGGAKNLACVDLFADSAFSSSVYWDDLSLAPPGPPLTCDADGPYSGEVGQNIHFTGSADGGMTPYTWAWTFGDSGTSTDQNPTHAYTAAGVYNVTLTVTDAVSSTATATTIATITIPQPHITIDSITGGLGIKAVIKNTGTADATNVSWKIELTGGIILLGKSRTGAVDIAAGGTATVKDFVFGFGKTTIAVTAGTAEKTATGTVLLILVLKVA